LTTAARAREDQRVPALTANRSWQLPWLRLHLAARELLNVPASSPDWPEAKAALVELATIARTVRAAGCFN